MLKLHSDHLLQNWLNDKGIEGILILEGLDSEVSNRVSWCSEGEDCMKLVALDCSVRTMFI